MCIYCVYMYIYVYIHVKITEGWQTRRVCRVQNQFQNEPIHNGNILQFRTGTQNFEMVFSRCISFQIWHHFGISKFKDFQWGMGFPLPSPTPKHHLAKNVGPPKAHAESTACGAHAWRAGGSGSWRNGGRSRSSPIGSPKGWLSRLKAEKGKPWTLKKIRPYLFPKGG